MASQSNADCGPKPIEATATISGYEPETCSKELIEDTLDFVPVGLKYCFDRTYFVSVSFELICIISCIEKFTQCPSNNS
ncbi:unnamed protein product [Protopolystoma xenopodis]|uniref:Uncharacterized protein n=1 Tax=Protopolystoma xenopodis TaxID=117903 RepID=A0A3S5A5Q1_9PLAT|nr:unnamed protein product [Protopolystoma xenopodis]